MISHLVLSADALLFEFRCFCMQTKPRVVVFQILYFLGHHPITLISTGQNWYNQAEKLLENELMGPWFSGGLGSVRLMAGLNGLGGLFQTKHFWDSIRNLLWQKSKDFWGVTLTSWVGKAKPGLLASLNTLFLSLTLSSFIITAQLE